jgi:hypothetical protein
MPEKDERGLARIGNAYFMVRSSTGKTHAINPKTKLPYCGWTMVNLQCEPTDELPDDKHQPSCKVCQRHYDDPIKEELQKIKADLLEQIDEYLFLRVLLKDVDGLGRFTELIAKFLREEIKREKKIRKEAS